MIPGLYPGPLATAHETVCSHGGEKTWVQNLFPLMECLPNPQRGEVHTKPPTSVLWSQDRKRYLLCSRFVEMKHILKDLKNNFK